MKQIVVSLILICLCVTQSVKAVEWEARTGVSVSDTWGLHTAVLVGIPLSNAWQIRPGVWLHTDQESDSPDNRIGINIPIYASYRISMGNSLKLRLEAGPYVGMNYNFQIGPSVGVGIEKSHWYWGASFFADCKHKEAQLNASVGYNFSCK